MGCAVLGSRLPRRLRPLVRPALLPRAAVSERWGYDRGSPVDRWFIERFLATHAADIRGTVLEVKDAGYTRRFGAHVDRVDVLDIDRTNREANVIADLADAGAVPGSTYDCIVLTQTLQYVPDVAAAVAHVHRLLRPGGVVLATFPGITRVNVDIPGLSDYWRFTPAAAAHLFAASFGDDAVQVESFGSIAAATAFLLGLAAEELTPRELAAHDPRYAVIAAVRASKA